MALLSCCWCTKVPAQLTYTNLRVLYDSAWTYKNLQLIPIRYREEPGLKAHLPVHAITLSEGLAKGDVKVKEVNYEHGADINWVSVENHSKKPLIIFSGELMSGGKQDRLAGETKIIPPGQSDYLKVFCIEKGRWDEKTKPFKYSGSVDGAVKKIMNVTNRQAEVWKEIERQFAQRKITSATWPYLKLKHAFNSADSGYNNFFKTKFAEGDSAYAGFLAITGNTIINCELFSSAYLTSLAFPMMLNSLVQTATSGSEPSVDKPTQKTFLNRFLLTEAEQKNYLAGHGQIHYYQGLVLHLIAYPN